MCASGAFSGSDVQAIEPDSFLFLFDGKRIQPTQTANELKMEDDDQIDAIQQVG